MNKESIKINENAHTKIIKDMSQYLDECKKNKQTCQCTGVLEYNKDEKNELKKWKFIYQCNDQNKTNDIVKNVTLDLLGNVNNPKEETYKVK